MPAAEWRVLIADDEPAARRGVRQLLAAFPAFHVVAECRNGTETLARLDEVSPHVVFLDIQMPGIDGFEVIRRRTPERMPQVVFLTAYDEFALRAFEAQALDYLVKPASEERFGATMRRLARQLQGGDVPPMGTLVVTTGRGTMVLHPHEIDWIESADNYARLWLGGRSYLLRESMDSLERRMASHGFVRVHRGAIVRLGAVRQVIAATDGELLAVLSSGVRVPVSRRRRAAFTRAVRAMPR